jgi:hypothetical protein
MAEEAGLIWSKSRRWRKPPVCASWIRQVQVPGSRSGARSQAEAEAGAGQGSQAPPGYRRKRLPDQAAQHDQVSWKKATRQGDPALPGSRNGAPGIRHAPAGANQGGSRAAGQVEQMPKMEGRQMIMIIAPKPRKKEQGRICSRAACGKQVLSGSKAFPPGTTWRHVIKEHLKCPR